MTDGLTPLAEELIRRIRSDGPISIADFMVACLADPLHGYYTRRDPLGSRGDFITAPEISQIFGELIGIWCLSVWQAMGSPARFVLAELGPGRGTLMADALRAARLRPAFAAAAEVTLVEISEPLRAAQRDALQGLAEPNWIDRIDQLPPGPLIVIANEFFDALPIRQFVRSGKGWAERVVGLEGDRLAFGLRPHFSPPPFIAHESPRPGDFYEIRPSAETITEQLASRVAADGGAVLAIDYGHAQRGYGDTLQAVRAHEFDEPLARPGEADLTAHVDFAALAETAAKAGVLVRPIIDQATLLERLGIAARAEALARDKDRAVQSSIVAAVDRLTHADQMGTLFKALAFSSSGLSLPGFDT
jgi:NADH dehydrogenase [ubiquinone] 1 alpha subcomplex assembly factor 7